MSAMQMNDAELREQIHEDAGELEFLAGEYPHDHAARYMFLGFADVLRKTFELSDSEKIEILIQALKILQPTSKPEFAKRLCFPLAEANRLVDAAITSGLIEQYQEATNGRPATLLRLP